MFYGFYMKKCKVNTFFSVFHKNKAIYVKNGNVDITNRTRCTLDMSAIYKIIDSRFSEYVKENLQ